MKQTAEELRNAFFAIAGTMGGGWMLSTSHPEITLIQGAIYVGIITILVLQNAK